MSEIISNENQVHLIAILEDGGFTQKKNISYLIYYNIKIKGTNIFLNEDVSPATQSIRNAKMGELQAARQRGLIAYFSGTKLVTKTKRSTTQLSHENATSFGTADGIAACDVT